MSSEFGRNEMARLLARRRQNNNTGELKSSSSCSTYRTTRHRYGVERCGYCRADRLIAKKRDLKQAAMQHLHRINPPPGFHGEWGEVVGDGKRLRGVSYGATVTLRLRPTRGFSDLTTFRTLSSSPMKFSS
jgi:hypothetical protein